MQCGVTAEKRKYAQASFFYKETTGTLVKYLTHHLLYLEQSLLFNSDQEVENNKDLVVSTLM